MSQPSSRAYPLLRFAANVDWQHVNPALLQALNQLAAQKHVVVDVFSGYRSDAYSAAHGGFAGDPHTHGVAVDATVNGKPAGAFFSAAALKQVGLFSGNQPNFYKGKPDPSHIQLGTEGAATPAAAAPPNPAAAPAATEVAPPDPITDYSQTVPEGPQPEQTQPQVLPPGTPEPSYALWQRVIASSPAPDPQTQAYASLAQG